MTMILITILTFCFSLYGNIKEQIDQRWQEFSYNREFTPFEINKSDDVLIAEFQTIDKTRQSLYSTPSYERAENLILNDLIRAPGCGAFAYNNTVPDYNASTIYLGDTFYIACEGPRSKDIPKFFKMLVNHKVSHLVRLTDSYEGEVKKCHPYWEGLIKDNQLIIPTEDYTINAYDLAHWKDNTGIDPDELLDLALQVRGVGLLAVHCSAGVGRTGTFLAALAVLDAVDSGEPFSIEEIVYRLSLQRVHTVAKPAQYITLHRMAEAYLQRAVYLKEAG